MKLDLVIVVLALALVVVSLTVGLDAILGKALLAIGIGFAVLPLWRLLSRSSRVTR